MRRLIFMTLKSIILIFLTAGLCGCSHSDDVRTPANILGVWSPGNNVYLEFTDNYVIHNLEVTQQDGETIGIWNQEVYFYEPGYNLVVYVTYQQTAAVYQIVKLSDKELTWCWVEDIKASTIESEGIGNVMGQLINKAQEGFDLNPELYETFKKVPENQFLDLLESLDIMYPW